MPKDLDVRAEAEDREIAGRLGLTSEERRHQEALFEGVGADEPELTPEEESALEAGLLELAGPSDEGCPCGRCRERRLPRPTTFLDVLRHTQVLVAPLGLAPFIHALYKKKMAS